jgi:hypothetical protein
MHVRREVVPVTDEALMQIRAHWLREFNAAVMRGETLGMFAHPYLPAGTKLMVDFSYVWSRPAPSMIGRVPFGASYL